MGRQFKKSPSMHASVLRGGQFGRRALSTCLFFTPNSIQRRLNSNLLCQKLPHGRSSDDIFPSRKRGLRRLSAGTQHRSKNYPTPRRDVPDNTKQEQKQPVFSQGSLRFYATCHPGMPQHECVCPSRYGEDHSDVCRALANS